MNLIEKIIESSIRRYGVLALVIVMLLSIIGISLIKFEIALYIDKLSNQIPGGLNGIFEIPEILKSVILFIGFISLTIIILRLWGDFLLPNFFLPVYVGLKSFFKNNNIDGIPDISKWTHQGSLKIQKFLEITSSNSGCILKGHLYKNFTMNFKLRITNGGHLGIIFRAQDLENYLMLQILFWDLKKPILNEAGQVIKWEPDKHYGHIVVVPHIRFLGNFETFNVDQREPYHDTGVPYGDGGGEQTVFLEAEGPNILLKINNREFRWNLPTHTEPNIIQRPEDKIVPLDEKFTSKIWFRNRYGKIGFRAFGLEKAEISDLRIKEI